MSCNQKKREHLFQSVLSLVLALSIALTLPMYAQAAVTSKENGTIQGTFRFSPHGVADKDLTDQFIYTDEFFSKSAYEYNPHLATMSMAVTAASISSMDVDYPEKSRNLKNLLTDMGFEDFKTNPFYTEKPTTSTMGVAAAHKTIQVDGKAYTLLALVPRSAGYEKEWAGNFDFGVSGTHAGFTKARDIVLSFAKEYVSAQGIKGDVRLWSVGYSRGAGVTNLLGGYLVDNPAALGVSIAPENLYVYTFGTPPPVPDTTEFNPTSGKYANIFSIFSDYDIVIMAPFKEWNFTRYGTVVELPVHDAAAKAKMLTFLKTTNPSIYAMYIDPSSGSDPDNFSPKKIEMGAGGVKLANDTSDTAPAERTQKDFLRGRTEFLTEMLIVGREAYATTYQHTMKVMAGLYFGLSSANMGKFIEGIAAHPNAKAAAAMLYVYYLAERYREKPTLASEMLHILQDIEKKMKDDPEYQELIATPEYTATISGLNKRVDSRNQLTAEDVAKIKGMANDSLKEALTGGLTAVAATAETVTEVTHDSVTLPLIDLAAFTLFGSKNEAVSLFSIASDQLKMAATLLGNAGSYMRVHNNEILISWLRTQDSYYNGVVPPHGGGGEGTGSGTLPENQTGALLYTDTAGHWAESSIAFVVQKELMTGTSATTFSPDLVSTRGMMVTILYRLAGSPAVTAEGTAWYAVGRAWAKGAGISTGTDMDSTITREQLLTMLYRHAKWAGINVAVGEDTNILDYDDVADVSQWAIPALQWACGAGILQGKDGSLHPQDTVRRGEAATMIQRFQALYPA